MSSSTTGASITTLKIPPQMPKSDSKIRLKSSINQEGGGKSVSTFIEISFMKNCKPNKETRITGRLSQWKDFMGKISR